MAPTVALSLFALLGAGGLAFDYARLASLDTELQNAADQAALAAATQLDQQPRAMQRAVAAAQGLLTNQTLIAAGLGRNVTIPTVVFYATKADAENNTNPITNVALFASARFVRVAVGARRADYALTPIIGAITSGDIGAEAVAGLGAAICKTPPVMICNPAETSTNLTFDANALRGAGLRLVSVGGGNGGWAPGNFGYLDTSGGSNGAPGLREALGWNTPPGDCIAQSGVDTKPGATVTVTDALNTRFDIFDSNVACPAGGACGASINSVKDVVRPANANGGNMCRLHTQGWQEVAAGLQYLPTSPTTALATTVTPGAMGHPRDMCHAVDSGVTGACTGPIGNGLWDRDAYFRTHYRKAEGGYWQSGTGAGTWRGNTGLPANATRYEVYRWEYENRGTVVDGVNVLGPNPASATGSTNVAYGSPQCSAAEGYAPVVPSATVPDRRRISVAVVNCVAQSVNGAVDNLPVVKWIDVFLVQPSLNRARTSAGDVYAEVIGETQTGAGATAGQVVRRDIPYLVK
ncbi:pilus assembly protein TadG-related protein [Sphingomonas sp. LY160]|uniref:pilus assembly protein TadG-related protein n=1 Tax=Sphingomonas sp. LY160 TaxID=3095342 RepID=UPI002ADED8B3|nr:pilus assembly protein TadG-related protein [Sphingomonas sp. LY160]MEA1072509.1 pilus assembly protein TadG-related protein [Sphingomonas sp. LY160]